MVFDVSCFDVWTGRTGVARDRKQNTLDGVHVGLSTLLGNSLYEESKALVSLHGMSVLFRCRISSKWSRVRIGESRGCRWYHGICPGCVHRAFRC